MLTAEQELRFEVDWNEKVVVRLREGLAEIYGTELALDADYEFFGGTKLAIYTWHGCKLSVTGICKVVYTASETPMNAYLNTHMALEALRRETACGQRTSGPCVIIVGPPDSGKSTLARILLSYAHKMGHQPLYVDLDPREGSIMIPTTVGIVAIDRTDVEEPSGFPLTSSPPLIYNFGHHLPSANIKMFTIISEQIAKMAHKRAEVDNKVRIAGTIIDTHAWDDETSFDLLKQHVQMFHADAILVVGQERLYNEVKTHFENITSTVKVIKLSKSEGVVSRDKNLRRQMQMKRIREYFYGTPKLQLSPYSSSVSFTDISVRRIGKSDMAPDSALPIGAQRIVDETELLQIPVGDTLLHTVLAVSNAEIPANAITQDEVILPVTNLAGFIYVSEVDERKKRLKILCPNPGTLPKRYLWLGNLSWAEV